MLLLLFALIVVPILEIALFIEVGGWLGLWPTLAIVVATAVAGSVLLRTQGLETVRTLQSRLDHGGDPTGPLAHGALILVAGVVLLTPGFFTDAIGFLLLVPPVRALVIRSLARRAVVHTLRRHGPGAAPGQGARPGGRRGGGPSPWTPERDARGETVEADYEEVGRERGDDNADGGRRDG